MAFASGTVIDTPAGEKAFAAIIAVGDHVIFNWPVDSVAEGEDAIIRGLTFLNKKAREEGGIPDA